MHTAILLSGTPGSGKDTLTTALHELDPCVVLFRKHRTGKGGQGSKSYLDVTSAEFDRIVADNGFLEWHSRYNRSYGISRVELQENTARGLVSVIHVGKYENLLALRSDVLLRPALSILLLCSREETRRRLESRHPDNALEVSERLSAFDEERAALNQQQTTRGSLDFDLVLETTNRSPVSLANDVLAALAGRPVSKNSDNMILPWP